MRIVKERTGLYRYPEPKILSGSNYADVGFEMDADTGRVVALCAIDNLMKGAAGTAVQCVNVMMGWDETLGLELPGAASDLRRRHWTTETRRHGGDRRGAASIASSDVQLCVSVTLW